MDEEGASNLRVLVADGVELPYPQLRQIVEESGLQADTPSTEAFRLLREHMDQLFSWAYGKIVADCRRQGVLPVWVLVPAPTDVGASIHRGIGKNLHEIAREAGVKKLVLVHVVPPVTNFLVKRMYLKGVDDVYDGEIVLGEDMDFFELKPKM